MKAIKVIVLALLMSAIAVPQQTSAAALNPVKVYIQGEEVAFDQPPVIADGRVLVPFRQIAEGMEISVSWDQKAKLVTAQYKSEFKSKTVKIPVNGTTATVDNTSVKLDVPAKIINGRILVPLRFLSQSFGAKVDWNNAVREVDITYWQLKDQETTYHSVWDDGAVMESYTESAFDAKLNEMDTEDELVVTTKWSNLMDAGRIGIVSHHYGFKVINGTEREALLVLDGELDAQGKFDGSYYIELYDADTGDYVDGYDGELENAAFSKVVLFSFNMAAQAAGWTVN